MAISVEETLHSLKIWIIKLLHNAGMYMLGVIDK